MKLLLNEQDKKYNIIGYHGTDDSVRQSIEQNNSCFKIKNNDEHWITNGVYFFLEKETAEWWATSKHKFGIDISNPIVIKAEIIRKGNNICDLRKREDYNLCLDKYREFIKQIFGRGTPEISKVKNINNAFFKFFRETSEFDVFIVGFEKNKENILKKYLNIPYVEYQMCVCDTDLIDIIGYYEVKQKRS